MTQQHKTVTRSNTFGPPKCAYILTEHTVALNTVKLIKVVKECTMSNTQKLAF